MIATIDTELVRIARTMLASQNRTGVIASVFWTELQRAHIEVPRTAEARERLLDEIGVVVLCDEDDEDSMPVIRLGV